MQSVSGLLVIIPATALFLMPYGPARAEQLTAINPSNGHTYVLLEQSSWSDAENHAVDLGGHLATIDDAAENEWVYDTFGRLSVMSASGDPTWIGIWIGLWDPVGLNELDDYVWVDGSDAVYRNWDTTYSEPSSASEQWVGMFTEADPRGRDAAWNDFNDDEWDLGLPMRGLVEISIAAADLGVEIDDDPDPVTARSTLSYQVDVTNYGPDPADNVTLTVVLTRGLKVIQPVETSRGYCDFDNATNAAVCDLGSFSQYESAIIAINVSPNRPGTVSLTATVEAGAPDDPAPYNNTETEYTIVNRQ
jgi:uncharacterized repeat protein (TIGR01451 family)